MKRVALAAGVAALAFPASALAAGGSGAVLSVDGKHHAIQVVDAKHLVHAYRYRGKLPNLHAGSRISFQRVGKLIRHVHVNSNRSRTVSFLGRVVKSSSKGLVLRLGDGRKVKFTRKQVRHPAKHASKRHTGRSRANDPVLTGGNITINIVGLQPGITVLVTETVDPQGNVTITITLPPVTQTGGEQSASGTVVAVDTGAFVLETADGSDLNLHMAQSTLDNLNLNTCDTADVTYHQDAGLLLADTVQKTGTSNADSCSDGGADQDVVGTITQVSGSSLTVNTTQGAMTFSVDDPETTDGYVVGDQVDVTYSANGDGTYSADDVEYVEQDTTGTVTDVSDASMTITDDSTGQPVTFTANPDWGMFDGISAGDHVDVTFHLNAGQPVVDAVDDSSFGGDD